MTSKKKKKKTHKNKNKEHKKNPVIEHCSVIIVKTNSTNWKCFFPSHHHLHIILLTTLVVGLSRIRAGKMYAPLVFILTLFYFARARPDQRNLSSPHMKYYILAKSENACFLLNSKLMPENTVKKFFILRLIIPRPRPT